MPYSIYMHKYIDIYLAHKLVADLDFAAVTRLLIFCFSTLVRRDITEVSAMEAWQGSAV